MMNTLGQSGTDTATSPRAERSAVHNASVDEYAAREGECAQVHLPTGRMCTLPYGHKGSCQFVWPEVAYASLRKRGAPQLH